MAGSPQCRHAYGSRRQYVTLALMRCAATRRSYNRELRDRVDGLADQRGVPRLNAFERHAGADGQELGGDHAIRLIEVVGMTTRSGPTVMIGLAPHPWVVISSSGHLPSRTW